MISMGDIVKIYPQGSARNPDAVLEQAVGEYESVFVIGLDKEGALEVRSSTNLDHKEILWLMEVFKSKLLKGDYFTEEGEL